MFENQNFKRRLQSDVITNSVIILINGNKHSSASLPLALAKHTDVECSAVNDNSYLEDLKKRPHNAAPSMIGSLLYRH